MLNWTPFLERRTWLQSQTHATTNCHISLLLSSKLWGFIWRFHSLSPTWTSMTPSLLDMTFQLRANPGECMVDCKQPKILGPTWKVHAGLFLGCKHWGEWKWFLFSSIWSRKMVLARNHHHHSIAFNCAWTLGPVIWTSSSSRSEAGWCHRYCNTLNCGGQANLAWLLCWSSTKTPPSYM